MEPDLFDRTPISDGMKSRIAATFAELPEGARAAMLVITHEDGVTRAQVAAKIGGGWKVAAGGGYEWHEKKPYGYIAVAWAR